MARPSFRRSTRHRLDRRNAERLIPRDGDEDIRGAVIVLQCLPATSSDNGHQVLDLLRPGWMSGQVAGELKESLGVQPRGQHFLRLTPVPWGGQRPPLIPHSPNGHFPLGVARPPIATSFEPCPTYRDYRLSLRLDQFFGRAPAGAVRMQRLLAVLPAGLACPLREQRRSGRLAYRQTPKKSLRRSKHYCLDWSGLFLLPAKRDLGRYPPCREAVARTDNKWSSAAPRRNHNEAGNWAREWQEGRSDSKNRLRPV